MRSKKLLAAFLLGIVLSFVSVLGYGEVRTEVDQVYMDIILLKATVSYMMDNPTNFLDVSFSYDVLGTFSYFFPEGVTTKSKIFIMIIDNRGIFSDKSERALLSQFKKELEAIYSSLYEATGGMATDMNTDIVAAFYSREQNPLGGFYQGEYHLWEK